MNIRDSTLEDKLLLKSQFLDINLEDKVVHVVDDDKNGGGPINMEEDVLANKNDVLTKV